MTQQTIDMRAGVTSDPVANSLAYALQALRSSPDQRSPRILRFLESAIAEHRGQPAANAGAPGCSLAPWQLRKSQQLMLDRLESNISSHDLAKACHLSRSHFARAFKRTVGVSPHRWLLLRRVDKAKMLLATPRYPLAQIAMHCGFSDQPHFTRIFKTLTGSTPACWRRANFSQASVEAP